MITSKGDILFKADETTKGEYEAVGSSKHSRMPYYTVQHGVLEDDKTLLEWAGQAIEISK